MKYITFLFAICLSFGLSAQSFFIDAGVKAQFGGTGLINSAVADHPDWNYDIATGLGFGGKVGFNFEDHGITVDVLFGKNESSFETDMGASNLVSTWKYTDIYLLYRLSRYRGYLEVGPKVSFLNEVENRGTTGEISDVTSFYNNNGFAGVLGFGTYLIGSDGRFSGIFGLRFEYGLTDYLNQAAGEAGGYPVAQPDLYAGGYQPTMPLFAGLVFELNWGIGYYGKASCGARGKFIFL